MVHLRREKRRARWNGRRLYFRSCRAAAANRSLARNEPGRGFRPKLCAGLCARWGRLCGAPIWTAGFKLVKAISVSVVGATASRRGGAKTVAFASAKAAQRSLAKSLARSLVRWSVSSISRGQRSGMACCSSKQDSQILEVYRDAGLGAFRCSLRYWTGQEIGCDSSRAARNGQYGSRRSSRAMMTASASVR